MDNVNGVIRSFTNFHQWLISPTWFKFNRKGPTFSSNWKLTCTDDFSWYVVLHTKNVLAIFYMKCSCSRTGFMQSSVQYLCCTLLNRKCLYTKGILIGQQHVSWSSPSVSILGYMWYEISPCIGLLILGRVKTATIVQPRFLSLFSCLKIPKKKFENKLKLVHFMTWHQTGDKPLSVLMMI